MNETPGGSTEREGFSDDIAQLIVAVRALIGGHWDLFRAELGAISRDAVGVLLGAIAVITLVTAALLALLIAIFMLLGAAFFGSMIWGAAHVTLLLLVVAAAPPFFFMKGRAAAAAAANGGDPRPLPS
jgi:hypothetical protein